MSKTIVVGCDHAALDLKNAIVSHLKKKEYDVVDVGTYTSDSCNYPTIAHQACAMVQTGEACFGILVCGTGIGMSMAANKHHGIRAALCSDTFSACATREHNDANVLCMGARVIGEGLALDIVDTFLAHDFLGGRHQTRVDMVMAIETTEK